MTSDELKRRWVHVGVGAFVFLLPTLGWRAMFVAALSATAVNAWLLGRVLGTRCLLRAEPGEGRVGLILYPASVATLLLVFRDDHAPIQVGWLALAVGDGLAPLLGTRLRRPRWPWCPRKSVSASTVAFALSALVAIAVCSVDVRVATAGAMLGLLGETLPLPVDDNLSVPFFAALGAFGLEVGWT